MKPQALIELFDIYTTSTGLQPQKLLLSSLLYQATLKEICKNHGISLEVPLAQCMFYGVLIEEEPRFVEFSFTLL